MSIPSFQDTRFAQSDINSYGSQINCSNTMALLGVDRDTCQTLGTSLAHSPTRPDITIQCGKCGVYINVRQLPEHRAYHNALDLFKYKDASKPQDVAELVKRRNALIRQIKGKADEDNPVDCATLKTYNDAFEFLKSDLEDTYDIYRHVQDDIVSDVEGVGLNSSPQCVLAIGMCSSQNEKWKTEMEDSKVYQDSFGPAGQRCYIGLFDGHHGSYASEAAADKLHRVIETEMESFEPSESERHNERRGFVFGMHAQPSLRKQTISSDFEVRDENFEKIMNFCKEKYEDLTVDTNDAESLQRQTKKLNKFGLVHSQEMADAYVKSYHLLDILLAYGRGECSKVRWSGCSALTMAIQDEIIGDSNSETGPIRKPNIDGSIHLANAGTVKAVLVRGNRAHVITKEHSLYNEREKSRVIKDGGTISKSKIDLRVNGVIAATRGLGNHGDPKLKKCILVEPYTTSVPIDEHAQMLILATTGVWQVFSENEVASLLLRLLPVNQIPPPERLGSSIARLLHESTYAISTPIPGSLNDLSCPDILDKIKMDAALQQSKSSIFLPLPDDLVTEVGSHVGESRDVGNVTDMDLSHIEGDFSRLSDILAGQTDVQRQAAKVMAEYLVQAVLLAGSRENISVIVVLLPGCKL